MKRMGRKGERKMEGGENQSSENAEKKRISGEGGREREGRQEEYMRIHLQCGVGVCLFCFSLRASSNTPSYVCLVL